MNIVKKKSIIFALIISVCFVVVALGAQAQVFVDCKIDPETNKEVCMIGNPLGKTATNDITGLICLFINLLATKLMPPVVVLMVLWASFLFLTAAGQPGKIVSARTTLLWAVIGTAVLLMAVPLVSLVATAIGGSASPSCSTSAITSSVFSVLAALINWFSWLLAILSVVMGLYAGFLYLTSRGEPQKVSTANKVIFYAVVGVLVAIISFSLVSIINTFITIP